MTTHSSVLAWRIPGTGEPGELPRQLSRGSAGEYQADERPVSRGSAGEYQADERAGVARLSWRVSGR